MFRLSAMAIGLLVIGLPMPSRAQGVGNLPPPEGRVTRPWNAAVREASTRFALPEAWIHAVITIESGGDPGARSPKGAMGLMQLMPGTWAAISMQEKLGQNPFDLRANVLAGTAYLRGLIDRYGDLASALAAYNAGPRRIDDWRLRGRALPAETLAYVARLSLRLGLGASLSTVSFGANSALKPPDWRDAGLFGPGRGERSNTADVEPEQVRQPMMGPAVLRRSPGLFVALSQRSEK